MEVPFVELLLFIVCVWMLCLNEWTPHVCGLGGGQRRALGPLEEMVGRQLLLKGPRSLGRATSALNS